MEVTTLRTPNSAKLCLGSSALAEPEWTRHRQERTALAVPVDCDPRRSLSLALSLNRGRFKAALAAALPHTPPEGRRHTPPSTNSQGDGGWFAVFVFPDRGGCAETPLLIHMIIVVLGGLVQWFGVWVVYALALRVFVAALAVDLTALCWSFRAPLVCGAVVSGHGIRCPSDGRSDRC